MQVEEKYTDVLQYIEASIVSVCEAQPSLLVISHSRGSAQR